MNIQIKEITQLTGTLLGKITPIFGKFNQFMDLVNGLKLIKGVKSFFTLKLLYGVIFNFVGNVLDVMDFVTSILDVF